MKIQVVYALAGRQTMLDLELPDGATVRDALQGCRDFPQFSGVEPAAMPVGIYGRLVPSDTLLREGDRVEIYRPLRVDPKESRRRRVGKRRG